MYQIAYKCRNCYHAYLVEFPKGQEANIYFTCPYCGMDQLYKIDARRLDVPPAHGVWVKDGYGIRRTVNFFKSA